MVVGMNRYEPSSSGGMNSLPKPGNFSLTPVQSTVERTSAESAPNLSAALGTKANTLSNPIQMTAPKITSASGTDNTSNLCARHQRKILG